MRVERSCLQPGDVPNTLFKEDFSSSKDLNWVREGEAVWRVGICRNLKPEMQDLWICGPLYTTLRLKFQNGLCYNNKVTVWGGGKRNTHNLAE